MAYAVVVGETPGGPAEVQAALDAAITALSGKTLINIAIDGGLHTTRWVILYQTT